MLLHAGHRRSAPSADAAGALWYPLWDAGFVLGQSVRSVKEALAVADDDLDALTALLDVRLVAGDAALVDDLVGKVRRLAPRRRDRLVGALAAAAEEREARPGSIAEVLEPNLKSGAGGLRDVQTPGWVGWALPGRRRRAPPSPTAGRGTAAWRCWWPAGTCRRAIRRGCATPRRVLLDARVALHRVTGGRSDQLPLQDQDAVARLVGAADADVLVRTLGDGRALGRLDHARSLGPAAGDRGRPHRLRRARPRAG